MKKQRGFTLIELIAVIVILGILAATALPRFAEMSKDARIAAVNGMAGAMRSAVDIIHAGYMVKGGGFNISDPVHGLVFVDVDPGTGIPYDWAVNNMIQRDGFIVMYDTPVVGAVSFGPKNGGSPTCRATYDGTTGQVTVVTSGC